MLEHVLSIDRELQLCTFSAKIENCIGAFPFLIYHRVLMIGVQTLFEEGITEDVFIDLATFRIKRPNVGFFPHGDLQLLRTNLLASSLLSFG